MFSWQDLDLNQPINGAHPLNRGRTAWWLTIPQRYGAPTWWDLVQGLPGTLTSFASGYGWNSRSNPGGAGSLYFNASPYVSLGAVNLTNLSAVTFACWAYISSSNNYGYIYSTNFANFTLQAVGNAAPFNVRSYWGNGGGNNIQPSQTLSANTWYRLVFTGSSTGCKLYINGQQAGTSATAYSGNVNATATYLRALTPSSNKFPGYLNDVTIWNRALSATEVLADYLLSQEGYPDVLNFASGDVLLPLVSSAPVGSLIPRPFVYRARFEPAYFE